LAKIAVKQDTGTGGPVARMLASGSEWTISEVVCTAGPHHKPFEEQHTLTSVAVVLEGSFEYQSSTGSGLMTPGSLLLGNAGDCFCCGHRHGIGDRCISFSYAPHWFDKLAASAIDRAPAFHLPRLPAMRATAPLVTRASLFLAGMSPVSGEELSMQVAAESARLARGRIARSTHADAGSLARVSRVIRLMDNDPDHPQDLQALASIARLSPYHFLRVFEGIVGATPHQYVLRSRLRRAAVRLRVSRQPVLHIALDCGFGDVSNFNRAFRSEFGMSPKAYRQTG